MLNETYFLAWATITRKSLYRDLTNQNNKINIYMRCAECEVMPAHTRPCYAL